MVLRMVFVLCSICGEPSVTGDASCRVCDSDDRRAVPGPVVDATSEERLVESVDQTLQSLDRMRAMGTRKPHRAPFSQRQRALRVRLETQRGELTARIRGDHAQASGGGYRRALGRAERELDRSL